MKSRPIIFILLVLCGILAAKPAWAQLEVSDPVLDVQIPLEVSNSTIQVQGQYTTIAYAYQGYLHDLKEELQASEEYEVLANTFTTAKSVLTTAQDAYALAETAMSAPTILYDALKSEVEEYKSIPTARGDSFATTQPLLDLINIGSPYVLENHANSVLTPLNFIPAYYQDLSPNTQAMIRAHQYNMTARDATIAQALQRASDVQAHTVQDQKEEQTLESQTLTDDPTQHTELATLQRINKLLLLQLRAQQDANALNASKTMEDLFGAQQEVDSDKANTYLAVPWQSGMQDLSTMTSGASAALAGTLTDQQ